MRQWQFCFLHNKHLTVFIYTTKYIFKTVLLLSLSLYHNHHYYHFTQVPTMQFWLTWKLLELGLPQS